MEIIRLPVGDQAPLDADCLRIEEQPDGLFKLTASALCLGEDEGESVSIVGGPLYDTIERAEAAGTTWAETVGVATLHISVGLLGRPLKLMDVDLPL